MNILLLGSGGREHALAWKIAQSEKIGKLYIAPGNGGTNELGENVELNPNDFTAVKQFSVKHQIDFVVVGSEETLVKGIHDSFKEDKETCNITIIGPQKSGANLEGSKDFAKEFMTRHNIPTAKYKSVSADTIKDGIEFVQELEAPYVLKADGLAAGKGVLILPTLEETKTSLKEMLDGKFGDASKTVVIEEFLTGIEASVFIITDGESYKILPEAKDYKRIGEGDKGLNTGGMGAISPVPFVNKEFMNKVEEKIIKPTVQGLKKDKIPYQGFIFFGLISVNNDPYVIEYNVRMGDPETEVVIPRIKSDIVDLFEGVRDGNLNEKEIKIDNQTVSTVMLVSGGYPEAYEKEKTIIGLDKIKDSLIFHAGTLKKGGDILTNGGRVIAVSSFGENMASALSKSYQNAEIINFDGKYYRKDIGFDL